MALIREFHQVNSDATALHKPVMCGWRAFHAGHVKILQLDTYGSATRQIPNKISQSIQLDREGAAQLLALLRGTFPEIDTTT